MLHLGKAELSKQGLSRPASRTCITPLRQRMASGGGWHQAAEARQSLDTRATTVLPRLPRYVHGHCAWEFEWRLVKSYPMMLWQHK